MKKRHYALIAFIVLGIVDFAYGMIKGDQFSVFMGSLMVVVVLSMAYREYREAKSGKG